MTERIFVPNTPLVTARSNRVIQIGHRLHDLGAVGLVGEPLVDLEEGDDALHVPEVRGRALALDLPVHRVLEQDGAEHPIAGEARAGDDPGAHLVDAVEHLLVVRVRVLPDAVELRAFGVLPPL